MLLNPRVNNHTLLLWIAAPALLLVGLVVLLVLGRRKTAVQPDLTPEEQSALDSLGRHTTD